MTQKDTAYVFAILMAAYPYFYKDIRQDDSQMRVAVALWHEMLADYEVSVVKVALKRLIAVHKDYPPTIGQLLESVVIVTGNAAPDADEVWSEITRAIFSYGFYGTNEAMAVLSPIALDVIRAMDWTTLCQSENPETDRAHFLRIYQAIKNRHDQRYILPKDVQAFISAQIEGKPELPKSSSPPRIIDFQKDRRQVDKYEQTAASV